MSNTTRHQVTRKDLMDARRIAKRREFWQCFWIVAIATACAVGITLILCSLL